MESKLLNDLTENLKSFGDMNLNVELIVMVSPGRFTSLCRILFQTFPELTS